MGHPVIIQCRLIPRNLCINLFGTIWTGDARWINRYVINHERIHTRQQQELLFIPFYLLYILEWLIRLLQYRNFDKAYRNISFERESYANDKDLSYLDHRRKYTFLKYLISRRNNICPD